MSISREQSFTPEWHLLMAMASWRLGNFAESHEAAESALTGFRARGDADGEMRARNVAAAGSFAMGKLAEARRGFAWALALAQQFSDKLMMARCANNLGNVAYYRGDDREALRHYSHAASLFEQVGSFHGTAEAWHNTGVVLRERGEYEAAAEEDRPTETDCLRVLSQIAVAEGEFDEGVRLALAAVDSAEGIGNPWMVARTRQQLASTLFALHREAEAAEAYSAAATAFDQLGSDRRAETMRVLAARLR
jgi:tetratricopeptide (TPR) repeat protein